MRSLRDHRFPYAIVATLAMIIYLHTLRFSFVFDDEHLVANNQFLREPWSWLRAFGHDFWYGTRYGAAYYRPIVVASLALNGRCLGWGPFGFHLTNVVLHATNACLLLSLARRLGASGRASLLAACLFAVHPVAAWPVASVVARVDLLPAFFVLLAWNVYTRGRSILTGLSFLGALLCKESALAFLIVPLMGLRGAAPRRRASAIGASMAVPVYLAMRQAAGVPFAPPITSIDRLTNPLAFLPNPERSWAALALWGRYLLYLLAPLRFTDPASYLAGAASASFSHPVAVLTALVLAAIGCIILVLWWGGDALASPLAFGIGSFLPASNLLVPIASLYAQNFLYLPLLGASLGFAVLLERLTTARGTVQGQASREMAVLWLAPPLLAFLAVTAAAEASIWRDAVSLFSAWAERFPHYPLAQSRLGVALLDHGDAAAAVSPLRRALEMNEANAEAHYNLGVALILTQGGQAALDESLRHSRRAADLMPGLAEARVNAAKVLLLLDRPAEAESESRAALVIRPGFAPARANLAEALFRQSRYSEALPEFRILAGLDPTDPAVRSPLVVTLIHTGDLSAARAEAEAARRDFPSLGWFDFCQARIEALSHRRRDALALLRIALAKDPATRAWVREVHDFDGYLGTPELKAILAPAAQ